MRRLKPLLRTDPLPFNYSACGTGTKLDQKWSAVEVHRMTAWAALANEDVRLETLALSKRSTDLKNVKQLADFKKQLNY